MLRKFMQAYRGHILMQALIIMPLLYIALYLPFSFAVVQHKRSVLNDTLDMALKRAAVEGGLTANLRQEVLEFLVEQGFSSDDIVIEPKKYEERQRGEIIEITIGVPGKGSSLKGIEAVGGTPPPDDWQIKAFGSIMSEKLP